jgi:radical SAM superfamily enzyme YgiQ (UPF0313 family)
MIVQRERMSEILRELRGLGAFAVVGGPWVTVQETYFGPLADVIFVGEAEQTWPQFLSDWAAGRHQPRYEQAERTDISTVPAPRLDLLRMKSYGFGSVQFSRGCPFACEFCDIIVTFGRKPRIKTSAQIIAELDALRDVGKRDAFIVDDNLIGNKIAIKAVLRDVIAWQRENGYPMGFFTEASIDLADDPELMQLMVDANIGTVFVGVETPNEASLRETKKLQNVRRGGSLVEKVHRIQEAGMEVWSGMILGFDNDDSGIFEAQRRFVAEARIVNAMVGMLSAIPKTPLHARLAVEGRLDPSDRPDFGTNVIPAKMGRDELRDGFLAVLRDLNVPGAYFDRLDALYLEGGLEPQRTRFRYLRTAAEARSIRALKFGRGALDHREPGLSRPGQDAPPRIFSPSVADAEATAGATDPADLCLQMRDALPHPTGDRGHAPIGQAGREFLLIGLRATAGSGDLRSAHRRSSAMPGQCRSPWLVGVPRVGIRLDVEDLDQYAVPVRRCSSSFCASQGGR